MISRSESGKELTTGLSDYYQAGDYVVAKYTDSGHKQAKGKVYGDRSDVMTMAERIAKHALSEGEAQLATIPEKKTESKATKPVKGAKKKATKVERVAQPILKVDSFDNEQSTDFDPQDAIKATMATPKLVKEEQLRMLNVVFSNKLGRIKVKVIDVMDEETSIALVFKDDNDLTFEPQRGEVLDVILPSEERYSVMYPGFLYTWIDKTKKVMILVKAQTEEEE